MSDQVKEKILINGEIKYMDIMPNMPSHRRIREEKSNKIRSKYLNTGCWREYIGTWEIKDNKLYLVKIDGKYKLLGEPIFAHWVNDTIIVQNGELLVSHYKMYDSLYEQELHIVITDGIVTKFETIDSFDNKLYLKILKNAGITKESIRYKKEKREKQEKQLKESRKNHTAINFIFIFLLAIITIMFIIYL